MSEDKRNAVATEDMVRSLLQLNPHLRGDGKTTKDVLAVLTQAKGAAPAPAAASAPAAQAVSLIVEVDKLKVRCRERLTDADKRLSDAAARAAALDRDKKHVLAQAAEQVIGLLLKTDPNLTQRRNQVVLEKEKAFLDSIGFSVQKLLAAERKRLQRSQEGI